ncbi:MAG: PaaX family transcriptional regulator [Streptomyces turgidiscabies]|nr:PaaX family transcriptional regulator [Streptomyces turgidiscabies]
MTTVPSTNVLAEGETLAKAPQPRQFIVTVYGLYSRANGGWLSVASVVDLLKHLDVDEPAARSSIFRLKRRDILHAERRDGAAGYSLSEEGVAILAEGDERIFRREPAKLTDGWLLATFSVPEAERHKRHLLRSQLNRLGFGTAASGVWIAPARLRDTTTELLRHLELDGYADLFHADHVAFGNLEDKVRQWWDLGSLEKLYSAFASEHEPTLRRWRRRRAAEERLAFVDYVRLLTDWRRLPYLDPGLPLELLPQDWIGIHAADVFFSLKDRLEETARHYGARTIAMRQ